MLSNLHRKSLAASLALLLCGFTSATFAAGGSAPADLGPTNTSQTINVT
ncbi:MAG: hypothetical protein JO278_04445, partial [Dyella sp.]|nr:hypothetical protein [Dyella sp.]